MTDGTRAPAEEIGDDATAEVAGRAREQLWTASVTMLLYAAGAAMLFLEPWTWSTGFWLGSTAFLVAVLVAIVVQYGTTRGRAMQAGRLLSEYAVLHHADPGAGRRVPADEVAQKFVRFRFLSLVPPLGLLALPLIAGSWERPGWAIPGAVLLAAAAGLLLTAGVRQTRAGRRWLADPPGPPCD